MFALEHNGTKKPLVEWGISQPTRQVQSQGEDVFACNIVEQSATGTPAFPPGAEVTLWRGDVKWFVGRRQRAPRQLAPRLEQFEFAFRGPWSYLERLYYQQQAITWSGDPENPEALIYLPSVTLFRGLDGSHINVGEQVLNILSYAAEQLAEQLGAATIQPGAIDIPLKPKMEAIPSRITCAQAIRHALALVPDAVVWCDYSTTPPTIHVKRRDQLTAVTLPISHATRIEPREDLLVPAVVLNYRTTLNGFPHTIIDASPAEATGRELDAIVETFEFRGETKVKTKVEIVTQPINAAAGSSATDGTRLSWWLSKKPSLANTQDLEISNVQGLGGSLVNELVSGSISDLMAPQVEAQRIQITAEAKYRVVVGGVEVLKIDKVPLSISLVATNATTTSFEKETVTPGENIPPLGLAAQIREALNVLQFEGEHTTEDQECSDSAGIGSALNISGGDNAWATMNALIQAVDYDLETGRTTRTFGPAEHISIVDWVELLRPRQTFRFRQSSGVGMGASIETENPTVAPMIDNDKGHGLKTKEAITQPGGSGVVLIDGSHTGGRDIRLREYPICIGNEEMNVLLLGSEPF
jgi:hypothetical protein